MNSVEKTEADAHCSGKARPEKNAVGHGGDYLLKALMAPPSSSCTSKTVYSLVI